MKYFLSISFLLLMATDVYTDDHSEEQSFPGMVSSEVFDMGGGMEMHVEGKHVIREQFLNIFILQQEHLYMFLMVFLNQNHLVSGKNIPIMNIGLKNLIGFMEEKPMRQI